MTAIEYLSQARLLDQKINFEIREANALKEMAYSVSSPVLSRDRAQTSPSGDPPFMKALMRFWEMEEKINSEIDRLVDLKEQMRRAIDEVDDAKLQMVLNYRYFQGMTWKEIGDALFVDRTTAHRYHNLAIRQVRVPENAIII